MSPVKEKPGQRRTFAQHMRDVGLFIWNTESETFLGRSGYSWGLIIAFYAVFYFALAVYFTVNVALFFLTVDRQVPKFYGDDSLTQNNPGLGYRPMPNYDTSLIRFEQGKPSSYKPYTDHLQAFLWFYDSTMVVGKDFFDCCTGPSSTCSPRPLDKACQFKLDSLESTTGTSVKECVKENEFGYQEGQPCILIKLNKIYGWQPDVYTSRSDLYADQGFVQPSDRPRFLAFSDNFSVGLSCDGQSSADKENIQNITFFPSFGFNKHYFPYMNQEGYRSPLVFAKFFNVTKRVVIQVECRLYARNVAVSGGTEVHGAVHFELMID